MLSLRASDWYIYVRSYMCVCVSVVKEKPHIGDTTRHDNTFQLIN